LRPSSLIETLHDRPTAARVHLKVGALDAIPKHLSSHLVNQALALPNQKHPGSRLTEPPCSVSIIEGSPRELLEQLTAHRIDLILMNFLPPSPPGQLTSRQIARLPLTLVAEAKHFSLFAVGFLIPSMAYPSLSQLRIVASDRNLKAFVRGSTSSRTCSLKPRMPCCKNSWPFRGAGSL
jgi:DNA-binding transcriptional LysR family regulator